jgi:predicted O-methyltransferase YrrM
MPEFTRNWVRRKPRQWVKHLLPLKQDKPAIRLLEIGVFEGRSACWWLDNLLTREADFFLGIDPWDAKYMAHSFGRQEVMDEVRARAMRNLAPYGSKCHIYHGTSVDAFRPAKELRGILEPQSFDVAMIDGDHWPPGAMIDSVNTWSVQGCLPVADFPAEFLRVNRRPL